MGVLAFDLGALLSAGQGAALAVLLRDMSEPDAFGDDSPEDWQPLSTVPCVLGWDKSVGVRSANRVYVDPTRTVPISQGGMVVAADTDVTETDRVEKVLTPDGDLWIDGLFTITGVLEQGTHKEVMLTRSHLGG